MRNVCVLLLLTALFGGLFTGCSRREETSSIPAETTYPAVEHSVFYPDPPPYTYATLNDLVNVADYVLLGTVTEISFVAYPAYLDSYDIDTLYTIEATQCFKGNVSEAITLRVTGGIPNYMDEEQRKLAWEVGITTIFSYPDTLTLELGETYVLMLCEKEDGSIAIVNPSQYALSVKDDRKADITKEICYEDFKEFYNIED